MNLELGYGNVIWHRKGTNHRIRSEISPKKVTWSFNYRRDMHLVMRVLMLAAKFGMIDKRSFSYSQDGDNYSTYQHHIVVRRDKCLTSATVQQHTQ